MLICRIKNCRWSHFLVQTKNNLKTMFLILFYSSFLFANPKFIDSLTIPGCKYYVVFNDSISPLDSVIKICHDYYYFSNKSPIEYSKSLSRFSIFKSTTSQPCTLSFGYYMPSFNINQFLNCDSLSTYFKGITSNYYNIDSVLLFWSFPAVVKRKATNARELDSYAAHLRVSISSNGNRNDLYISKVNMLLSDKIINQSLKITDINQNTCGLFLNLNIKNRKYFKSIYNINGEILRDIPKEKIFIVKN